MMAPHALGGPVVHPEGLHRHNEFVVHLFQHGLVRMDILVGSQNGTLESEVFLSMACPKEWRNMSIQLPHR